MVAPSSITLYKFAKIGQKLVKIGQIFLKNFKNYLVKLTDEHTTILKKMKKLEIVIIAYRS